MVVTTQCYYLLCIYAPCSFAQIQTCKTIFSENISFLLTQTHGVVNCSRHRLIQWPRHYMTPRTVLYIFPGTTLHWHRHQINIVLTTNSTVTQWNCEPNTRCTVNQDDGRYRDIPRRGADASLSIPVNRGVRLRFWVQPICRGTARVKYEISGELKDLSDHNKSMMHIII